MTYLTIIGIAKQQQTRARPRIDLRPKEKQGSMTIGQGPGDLMRFSVWLLGKRGEKLGSVEARDEAEAIETAAKQFNIAPALKFKLVVTRIDEKKPTR